MAPNVQATRPYELDRYVNSKGIPVMQRQSILGMSCVREGPDTERASNLEWCLFDHLHAHIGANYGNDVRIVGHMFHFGGKWDALSDSFDSKVLYYSGKKHIRTDTVISKKTWNSLADAQLKELLANLFQRAMERIVRHALKKKLQFDGERFMVDVESGIRSFLDSDCRASLDHAKLVKAGRVPFRPLSESQE